MKISSYVVNSSAERVYEKVSVESIGVNIVANNRGGSQVTQDEDAVKVNISNQAKNLIAQASEQRSQSEQKALSAMQKLTGNQKFGFAKSYNENDLKIEMLDRMIYALTGKRYKIQQLDASSFTNARSESMLRLETQMSQLSLAGVNSSGLAGVTYEFQSMNYTHELETVSYAAQGIIKTADGQTINIDLSLNMSREFYAYSESSLRMETVFKDPLVINYGGTAASLTSDKYSFDLDLDGKLDQISFVGQGSGFLALDKNGDGTINDGSELFGPSSGSGFGELRAYDQDGNGWIDENDEVFSKLLVWSKDQDGNDVLYSLKELDIGAIYLGDLKTEFALNDQDNYTHGTVRSTSFFLKENGGAGYVQHVDLTI